MGFLQASGLATYLIFVSLFLNLVGNNINHATQEFYAPIVMLLFFIASAVISATLVLGRVGMLFWEKSFSESFKLLGHTILWILFYLGLFVLLTVRA